MLRTESDDVSEEVPEPGEKEFFDPHCQECLTKYKDPPPDTLIMYLHALKYSGAGWSYQTEIPAWANL